jgi:hypothetical protein
MHIPHTEELALWTALQLLVRLTLQLLGRLKVILIIRIDGKGAIR